MILLLILSLICLIFALGGGETSALCEQADLLQYLTEKFGGNNSVNLSSKFLVVQYMTEHIFDYGTYAVACTAWWSQLQGYGLDFFTQQKVESVVASASTDLLSNEVAQEPDHRWQKVWLLHYSLQRALSNNTNKLEYIVWIDSDLVVLDPSMRLERLCRSFPDSDLLVSKDFRPEHGLMNSGFMIFKVSPWSLSFLEAWWSNHDRASVSDQGAFGKMWATNIFSVRSHTVLLEPHVLNSEFPAWFTLQQDHQVLHLAGTHNELRSVIFRSVLDKLCNKDTEKDDEVGGQVLSRAELLLHLGRTRSELVQQALRTATSSVQAQARRFSLTVTTVRMVYRRHCKWDMLGEKYRRETAASKPHPAGRVELSVKRRTLF